MTYQRVRQVLAKFKMSESKLLQLQVIDVSYLTCLGWPRLKNALQL